MFTGIVERTARVAALEDRPGRRVITVEVRGERPFGPWSKAALGESISVSGVCLTVVAARGGGRRELVSFDAVPETLEKTTLGGLRVGDRVNIERSLRAGDRFGGHYVTGHVDGVGTIRSRRAQGDQVLFEVEVPDPLLGQVIPKGSIAVEGISLTVIDVEREARRFSFAVIPHTLEWTNLKDKAIGSAVNVETDAFGKWVLHAMELQGTGSGEGTGTGARAGGRAGAEARTEGGRSLGRSGAHRKGRQGTHGTKSGRGESGRRRSERGQGDGTGQVGERSAGGLQDLLEAWGYSGSPDTADVS